MNPRYALVSADDTTVLDIQTKDPATIYARSELAPGKPYWLPYNKLPDPAYDSKTEVLEALVTTIIPGTEVRVSRAKRKLTEEEKIARRADRIASAEPALIHLALLDVFNRLLVLEGESPITFEEMQATMAARLKAMEDA